MNPRAIPLLAAFFSAVSFLHAQSTPVAPTAPEDPAHNELRALKAELIEAVTKGDIERVLPRLDPDVVITWQNGEVCRGREAVKAFFAKMQAGSGKTWRGYKVPPTPDALTTLYANGTVGVCYGHNVGQYHLLGKEIDLPNRWTATLVKRDGQWMLASYHISMNVLDNPLLNSFRNGVWIAGGVALVVGVVIGRLTKRTKA